MCFYDQECNDADAAQYPSYGECLASFVSAITPNDMPCYSGTHAAEALEVMEGWSCEEGLIWPEVTDWVYQASSANTACGLGGT
ncbi:MAG: hypothetical protein JXX28_18670 [Deltaproteobacteria bacterium]|nr:hypothetical protein [Deltaproteobacteria bacterium]